MELGFAVMMVIALITGLVIGVFIGRYKAGRTDTYGELYVNPDAPEGQGLFLDQDVPTSVIATKKRVSFNVYVIRDNSRK